MAFGKSEYDELKDLGMTPAQIKEAIADSKKLKADHDTLKTEFDTTKTTLSTMENSFTQVKNKLAELEANPPRGRQQNSDDERKPKTSFIEDEDAAFNERFAASVGPVAQTALIAARNSAKMAAKMSLQGKSIQTSGGKISLTKLWEKWEREIEEDSKQVAMAALGDMNTWINMFNYVKGKHLDEMLSEPQTFVESVELRTDANVGRDRSNEAEKLNDEETSTIKKMSRYSKVTPEKYQEIKKKMTFVNV
jgi:hypothetical protein